MPPRHIAILGGGLTGLSSAFHLSQRFPGSLITLIEKKCRLGGWVRSEKIMIGDRSAILEAGPRTLRPNAKSVLELVHLLGLTNSVITTSKSAPASKVRFLHLPGTAGIVEIPTTLRALLSSKLGPILLPAVLREVFSFSNRPSTATDESLDSFMTRRFGESFSRTFGSALVHGIYASDSRNLSIRAAFPTVWEAEEKGWGSVIRGLFLPGKSGSPDDYVLGDTLRLMDGVSVYSFKDGMETLTRALEKSISSKSNIRILKSTPVQSIHIQPGNKLFINIDSNPPISPITVVNLVFTQAPSEIHPPGFGYLVPRPAHDYSGGLGILGTVFDSSSLHEQDSPGITKLTVMLGGPYPLSPQPLSLPTILEHLQTHLQRPLPSPAAWRVHRNERCIPTLMPGHLERIRDMKSVLSSSMNEGGWGNQLEVIGAGVGGVSVGDCVEAGKRVGSNW
ncbi:hypothetical protein BD779DRAFT_1690697 [Infundibulicybe gibba]|nr:hypothetical protein BD779DRAFT_1690697 [Infundibulicybe gibba]